jgi:hypothetical protein
VKAALPVLVVAGEGWHAGVLGLVASRLKERFNKPAFALGLPKDGKPASGSARSIAGVNLGAAVRAAVEAGVAVKGGGHAMAAGITVEPSRIGDLRAFLEAHLAGRGGCGRRGRYAEDRRCPCRVCRDAGLHRGPRPGRPVRPGQSQARALPCRPTG